MKTADSMFCGLSRAVLPLFLGHCLYLCLQFFRDLRRKQMKFYSHNDIRLMEDILKVGISKHHMKLKLSACLNTVRNKRKNTLKKERHQAVIY